MASASWPWPEAACTSLTSPQAGPCSAGSVDLGDIWAQDMFLSGDRVLILGQRPTCSPSRRRPQCAPSRGPGAARCRSSRSTSPIPPHRARRPCHPDRQLCEAHCLVGTSARIVMQESGPALPWAYPTQPGTEAAAAEANRQLILNSTVADWLPSYSVQSADGAVVAEGPLVGCDRGPQARGLQRSRHRDGGHRRLGRRAGWRAA